MTSKAYLNVDEWLGEIENFSLRAERIPVEAIPWVKTAWQLATRTARVQERILLSEIKLLKEQLEGLEARYGTLWTGDDE